MDINDLYQLARLMQEMNLSALEVSEEGRTIKLEQKNASVVFSKQKEAVVIPEDRSDGPGSEVSSKTDSGIATVSAPLVGVFYAAPSPEAKPFVFVGDKVKKGDVLCIIEAMKIMNEITSEQDGTVAEVCAVNGQVVEYGHPLFRIK